MPQIYQFSEIEFLAFFLVLVRMTSFLVSWPVFGVAQVPSSTKVLFGLVLSLLVFPTLNWKISGFSGNLQSMTIVFLFVKEAFLGLIIGYLGRLFFYALSIAGEIISITMGLSSAQLFNPTLEGQASVTNQFLVGIATLFFLAIQGHHLFLSALNQSFQLVPLYMESLSFAHFEGFSQVVQAIMIMGLKMSAPVLMAVLFMNLVMAVIGRAVPQINVLITSLPVNILVGFIVMIISLPLIVVQMNGLLELTATELFKLLKAF
ncbi:MAG: flagellar biosynthetic protein FliR [Bdellovibrionaceae bacterium]|nr:flagellar biosynthetic protein FliR [Pseudobdellovibrionaceae bacterium]